MSGVRRIGHKGQTPRSCDDHAECTATYRIHTEQGALYVCDAIAKEMAAELVRLTSHD